MKGLIKYFWLGFCAVIVYVSVWVVVVNQPPPSMADPSVSAGFSSLPLPSPTPTSLPALATPKALQAGTPTPEVSKYSSEEIYHLIDSYSGQYGVDANVVRHIAICESGFNSLSVNGKYAGLFQFDTLTWRTNRQSLHLDFSPALRLDAGEAIRTAVYIVSTRGGGAWPNCFPK